MHRNILNIHGYRGTAHNTAYRVLDELYPAQVVSPQFDYEKITPNNIISILDSHIKSDNIGSIVGTSFGGFFACCAGCKHEIPIILVNPCLLPFITLKQISETYNFAKNGRQLFELFGQYMGELDKRYLSTIIAKSDEIINHEMTTQYLVKSDRWYEIDGNHHIENTDKLSAAFREIFTYYDECLYKIQEGETIFDI